VCTHYFKRPLITHSGDAALCVVYAVKEAPAEERTDPVRVVAAFPAHWRPTMNPGEVLHDQSSHEVIWMCEVPRSGFLRRHYTEISREEALALYPELAPRQATTATS
jgi:hypothetical protein